MNLETFSNISFEDMRGLAAGFAALIQVAVLPGWLIVSRLRTGALFSDALAVLAVSLACTFNIVLLLQFTGGYDRTVLSALALVELLVLAIRSRQSTGITTVLSIPCRPWSQNGFFVVNVVVSAIMVWFVIRILMVLWSHIPGVFEAWDVVVSWNRWAADWYEGCWPTSTYGYPQLMPVTWSVSYLWLGSDQIEFFARALMGLFPLLLLAIFADIYWRWRRPAPLIAAILQANILLGPYASVLDSGYVDIPATFLIVLTAYLTYLAAQKGMSGEYLLILSGIVAAAAVLCKQSGFLAVGIFIVGLFCVLTGRFQVEPDRRRQAAFRAIAVFALFASPWFVLKLFNFIEVPETNIHYVTSLIYGSETLLQRLVRALTVTLPAILFPAGKSAEVLFCLVLVLLLAACRTKIGKLCLSFGIPYLLIWALFFSYDERNLLPALPFLCLATGLGFEQIIGWWVNYFNKSQVVDKQSHQIRNALKLPQRGLSFVLMVIVSLAVWPVNPVGLKRWNENLLLRSGDAILNQQLIEFSKNPGFCGQVFTTYPQMISITALRPYAYTNEWRLARDETIQAFKAGSPFCGVLRTMPGRETITYALIHTAALPELINPAIVAGYLQPVITTPTARLLKVSCK